jgi:cellulose biosynthesis protein BcsQ
VGLDVCVLARRKESQMILVFANGKGGVAKSTSSSQIAAVYAEQGRRVLVIDLDPQSNQAEVSFGLDEHDEGRGLFDAVYQGNQALAVPVPVRDNIDLLAAGEWTAELGERIVIAAHHLGMRTGASSVTDASRAAACHEVRAVIQAIAANYDVTVIDTPPAYGNTLAIAGLLAAEYLVIPTKAGKLSRSGLSKLVRVYQRHDAPCLLLGVVLVGVTSTSKSLVRSEMSRLEGLFGEGEVPLLGTVRAADRATYDQEEAGLLAGEYHEAAQVVGRKGGARFATNTEGLLHDYKQVAAAIDAAIGAVTGTTKSGDTHEGATQ